MAIGITATPTVLREEQGTVLTITITSTDPVPASGIVINVDSGVTNALGQLDVFASEFTNVQVVGVTDNTSGFRVRLRQQTGTLRVPVYDDNDADSPLNLTFTVLPDPGYTVDPSASSFTVTIEDAESAPIITPTPTPTPTPTLPMTTPIVSLQTITGTYDSSDNLLAPALVQSPEESTSLLTFVFSANGEVPEDGLVVTVDSTIAFRDLFSNLGTEPFTRGGEFVGAVFNYRGEATGFQFRLTDQNALINLSVKEDGFTDDPFDATFILRAGTGYNRDANANTSTVTFYNTIDQVPVATVTPEVSLSINNSSLNESTGNTTTLTFTLNEAPPPEGVLVYVRSASQTGGEGDPTGRDLAEFDLLNAQISGGAYPAPNFAANGFFFKIVEQTATITLPAFADGETEGIEDYTFELQQAPGYTIADNAGAVNLTVVDNAFSQIQASLTTEPAVLIETERTVSVHNFSLSATPPAEGITVSVSAPKLGEFDLSGIQVENGQIVGVNPGGNGFQFNITDRDATIRLPVAADAQIEGLDAATFTLLPGSGYQVNPTARSGRFQIVDIPEQAPQSATVTEPNDTIATAFNTRLSGFNPVFSTTSSIDYHDGVDATEDVDFFQFTLDAGDVVTIDTDANQVGREVPFSSTNLNTVLRLFNPSGTQVAVNNNASAPDEVFFQTTDSFISYTATTAGTYYAAVSSSPNTTYNPNVAGSGTGATRGEYNIDIRLNPAPPAATFIPPAGTPVASAPTVSVEAVTGVFSNVSGVADSIVVPNLVQSLTGQSGQSILTLSFNTTGVIPTTGLEVLVRSDAILTDYFNVTNIRAIGSNPNGPIYDSNGNLAGLRLNIFEPNASASLVLQNLSTPETDGPEPINFSILPSSNYNVGTGGETASVTVYDTIAQASATVVEPGPQVGISLSQSQLAESEGETTLTFNVNGAIPTNGLLVYVDSPTAGALGELNLTQVEISGGVFPPANFDASGLYFNILQNGASITFSAFNDGLNEGVESFTYNLVDGPGYTLDSAASSFSFTIADNSTSPVIPPVTTPVVNTEVEPNDTIATATNTGIGTGSSSFTVNGAIAARTGIDASEDVDLYSFTLNAGQTVAIDVDAAELDSLLLYSQLRIFDTAGTQLASTNFDDFQAAPDEVFSSFNDPYLEFTAASAGTYFVGISQLDNNSYNPFTAGSGSGAIFPDFGIETGPYTLSVTLA